MHSAATDPCIIFVLASGDHDSKENLLLAQKMHIKNTSGINDPQNGQCLTPWHYRALCWTLVTDTVGSRNDSEWKCSPCKGKSLSSRRAWGKAAGGTLIERDLDFWNRERTSSQAQGQGAGLQPAGMVGNALQPCQGLVWRKKPQNKTGR